MRGVSANHAPLRLRDFKLTDVKRLADRDLVDGAFADVVVGFGVGGAHHEFAGVDADELELDALTEVEAGGGAGEIDDGAAIGAGFFLVLPIEEAAADEAEDHD